MPRIRNAPEPTIDATDAVATMEPPSPPEPAQTTKPVAILQRRVETVTLSAPLGEIGPGYRSTHVQAFLDNPQAETMQRLVVGLRDRRDTTANGREIRSAADAVRWLLEQIGC